MCGASGRPKAPAWAAPPSRGGRTPVSALSSASELMGLRRCAKWGFTVYNRRETTRGDATASQAEMRNCSEKSISVSF